MSSEKKLLTGLSALMLSACTNLAPDYSRPDAPIPAELDALRPEAAETLRWQDIVTAAELKNLISAALENNRDLRAAAANTRIARARLDLARTTRLPVVSASGSVTDGSQIGGNNAIGASTFYDSSSAQIGVSAWELDFFGRLQNETEAARQSYLSVAADQRAAEISVAAAVLEGWMQLAADQLLLDLSEETARSQGESLALTQRLFEAGTANELDVRRASASVESARAQAAQYKALVQQDLNTLRLLVGGDLPEGLNKRAAEAPLPVRPGLNVGTSSDILLSRPDVMAAEHALIAANANIGAARAAFFPTISLTGSLGRASGELGDLFSGPGATGYSFGPSISLPIFDGGARKADLAATEAERDLLLAQYEGSIQTAFREAADALAIAATIDERVSALERFVDDTSVTLTLSNERFRLGVDSYLSVLDAQRESFSGRQQLILTQLEKGLNTSALYRAVGVN